ncbi:MAG: flavin reductase family protein [Erysipelotrichia bacterium]|nr:flavin reductase family protein [Erysipelotrichia bacterium]NCC55062.1 flavin reductase family protein [Erysipelotrichia bacterium]
MQKLNIEDLTLNPFIKIGKEWCLIGVKNKGVFNAMTASWGGLGVIWNKNVVTIYVRPQRYTRELLEESDTFTISFFDETYKKALNVYGTQSGRNVNKEQVTGLSKVDDGDYAYLKEANLVFECQKIYCGKLDPKGILLTEDDKTHYPLKDYHYIYMGEIKQILEAKE